jgi:hypothetical protein
MRRVLVFLLVSTLSTAYAQHKIQITATGLKDEIVFLGHYAGDKSLLCDTATVTAKSEFVFEGRDALEEGLYFISSRRGKLFEFVVGENQFFDMKTSADDYVTNMKVENDQENMIFFESLLFNRELYREAEPLIKSVHDSTLASDKKRTAQIALNRLKLRGAAYQEEVIENFPDTITAKLFKSARTIELGEQITDVNTASQREWYQSHLGLF